MAMIPPALQPPYEFQQLAKSVVDNAAGIHEMLNACEQCGLPVADRRAELNAQCEFCNTFLRNFFPDSQ